MAVLSLAEAEILKSSSVVPLFWSVDGVVKEPWFDYDDEGELKDFGFDSETEDFEDMEAVDSESLLYDVAPSQFAETAIRIPEAGRVSDFSFEGREYLRRIYDTPADKVLLTCGRQVEKCQHFRSLISMEDGSVKELQNVEVGDRVVGLSPDGSHTEIGEVTWKSKRRTRACVKIVTRQGHSTVVALTHPMRSWGAWDEAEKFRVGHRLAVARQAGEFSAAHQECDKWVILAAHMVAEGDTCGTPSFTQSEGVVLDDFLEAAKFHDIWYTAHPRDSKGGLTWLLKFVLGEEREPNPLREKLVEWGISEERSPEKHVPGFVWGLDQRQTALFLNRLWAGVGHASLQGSSYHLEYDSASEQLARDVQRLLWKFGIPTSFRRWKPALYKGTNKWAYKLRVETQEGARRFIVDIGALGKTESLPLPDTEDSSNRDVYPLAISGDIKAIHRTRSRYHQRGRYSHQPSLRSVGLREKPKYNLSRRKLSEYVEFFRSDDRFDQERVEALAAHLDTDLFWDEIVSVEDVGEQHCYDITVKGTESFVGDGFVTHNSTTLGNRLLCYSTLTNNFRSLFVAPSAEQAKVFSTDRVKDVIDTSPLLQAYTPTKISQAVFFKKFINFSQIRLRYAYLTADRVRGIPADLICVDELQDILIDNIPIIEQCAFHSKFKLFVYSGTPKSEDNTIEHYWSQFSTRNEWVVPCDRHGTPKDSSTWHWNVLGENNIGRDGLICDKCRKSISARHPMASWAAIQPRTEENRERVTFEGYRIPQIMVPWVDWQEILEAQEQYSRAQFFNEKLGLSYDSGVRPLTKAQLRVCCQDHIRLQDIQSLKELVQGRQVFGGIDWGSGESGKSYTVISFGGYLGTGNFTIFYIHRFTGPDLEPDRQLDIISQMITQLGAIVVGTDYGGGFYPNDTLMRRFGPQKIQKYQYNPRQKKKVYWEENLRRFMCHRSEVMTDVFNAMKRRLIDLPCWNDFAEPYGQDVLNIFSEYNERLRMIEYKKAPGKTDDSFHSILLCLLASMIVRPRPDILTPMKDPGVPYHHG